MSDQQPAKVYVYQPEPADANNGYIYAISGPFSPEMLLLGHARFRTRADAQAVADIWNRRPDSAALEVALEALRHYADYKNWPGANPNVPGSKASKEAWQAWYQQGGYHGYDIAREALAKIGE